ncbi:transcription regulator gal80 [Knufia fluminis]|uniref:Transcription regulator gal80 n=1 Tax=Knufia fluminis TaxID=191047 RepID=A0AAN8F1V5_9EURO|nr:transcription regulator gal80 [Knufia fluminis]
MAPIKVGILGLSTKPSAWATLAHYPYLKTSSHYKVTGVCNSTLQSSQAAIDHFNLADAKAHDSWESLARDPNVDLIVVSTRADTHYDVAKPALLAGKSVYVEWPLAANASQAREMSDLARQNGCRTIVGLQGRVAPSVLTVKAIVDSGRLGEIHSVSYQGTANVWQDNTLSERYHYFVDRKVGGTLLTIYGGHIIDSITCAVGELETWSTQTGNFRKTMKVKRDDGTLSDETVEKDTPDQMMLIGRLKRDPPAMFNFHLRAGNRFGDQPGSVWRVYGTKGELQMTFRSAGPQIGVAESLRVCDFEKGTVEDVVIDEGGKRWTGLPEQGQNIGRLYEAFATGKADVDYADWEHAVRRHEMIDGFYDTMV